MDIEKLLLELILMPRVYLIDLKHIMLIQIIKEISKKVLQLVQIKVLSKKIKKFKQIKIKNKE